MAVRLAVHLLRGLVLVYRYTLSGLLGRSCRFLPTCSEYALEALDTHGAGYGSWLTLCRLARCHPWGAAGFDPVPAPRGAGGGVGGGRLYHHHPKDATRVVPGQDDVSSHGRCCALNPDRR